MQSGHNKSSRDSFIQVYSRGNKRSQNTQSPLWKQESNSFFVFTLLLLTLPFSPFRKTFPSQHATLSGFAAVYISVSTPFALIAACVCLSVVYLHDVCLLVNMRVVHLMLFFMNSWFIRTLKQEKNYMQGNHV